MRGIGGVLSVSLTVLLVSCSADPLKRLEVSGSQDNLGDAGTGQNPLNLDHLGGGNLVRRVRQLQHYVFVPYLAPRDHYYESPYVGGAMLVPGMRRQNNGDDNNPKHDSDDGKDQSNQDRNRPSGNFDEIDLSHFGIDSRRSYDSYGLRPYVGGGMRRQNNGDDNNPKRDSDGKDQSNQDRNRPSGNFDEIDLSHFGIDSRRSYDSYGLRPYVGGGMRRQNNGDDNNPKRDSDGKDQSNQDRNRPSGNFDEIDLSHFGIDSRRSYDSYGLRPYVGGGMRRQNNGDDNNPKRDSDGKDQLNQDRNRPPGNFDEIDLSHFGIDSRRSYDSYGLSPYVGGGIRGPGMRRQNNGNDNNGKDQSNQGKKPSTPPDIYFPSRG